MLRTLVLIGFLSGCPALACSPELNEPSDIPIRGENCEVMYNVTEYLSVGLSEAKDLGHGFVLQRGVEDAGCGGAYDPIVMDCASGKGVIIGTRFWDAMGEIDETDSFEIDAIVKKVEESAAARKPLSIDSIFSLAETKQIVGRGRVDVGAWVKVGGSMGVNGKVASKRLRLHCACKTFYPDLG